MKLFVFTVLLLSVVSIDALNKQQDCKCRSQASRRIVGGSVVGQYLHPWYVNITTMLAPNVPTNCGGVIVNEDTILTAGHCTPAPNNKDTKSLMRVQVNGQILEVADIILHPTYTRIGFFLASNDLAIYKLKKPLTFSEQVQPGCFNLTKQDTYQNLKVVGYGSVTPVQVTNDLQISGLNPSRYFKEGLVRDVTSEKCTGAQDLFICVDGIEGRNKANVCLGDTGSPLVSESNGKSYVVGITGFPLMKFLSGGTLEFCSSGSFTARLSSEAYKSFLDKHAGGNYCH